MQLHLKIKRVIKSPASAVSPMNRIQGSLRMQRLGTDEWSCRGLPCFLAIGEAGLAADLIMRLIFNRLERNLAIAAPLSALQGFQQVGRSI